MLSHNRSRSASPRQPAAEKPLFRCQEYTTARGGRAFSTQLDVRDMARFYAEHPDLAGRYSNDWWSTPPNRYITRAIHNAGDALDAVAEFTLPAGLKRDAARASRPLAEAFAPVARLATVRHLTAGRLDRRKFAAIARHTAAGTYDPDRVRPYKRTLPTPVQPPTVAVVASAGWAEMWSDPGYIPRVLLLTLSVLWACEAAGLPCHASLNQNAFFQLPDRYHTAMQAFTLAAPGRVTPARAYAAALHTDLFRYGYITAMGADPAMDAKLAELKQGEALSLRWTSCNGGRAVRWAREVHEAGVVIAIGSITDAEDADIQLNHRFSIESAVAEIARQAAGMERA